MIYIPDTSYAEETIPVDAEKSEAVYATVMNFGMIAVGVIVAAVVIFFIVDYINYSAELRERQWKKTQLERISVHSVESDFVTLFTAAGSTVERLQVLLDITKVEESKNRAFMSMFYDTAVDYACNSKESSWRNYVPRDHPEVPDDASIDTVYAPLLVQWKLEHEETVAAQKEARERHKRFQEALYASQRSFYTRKNSKRGRFRGSSSDSGSSRSSNSSSSRNDSGSSAAAFIVTSSDSSSSSSDSGSNFSGGGDSGSY